MKARHVFLAALWVVLTACSSNPGTAPGNPLQEASAVSVTLPEFKTPTGTTLHWHRDLVWVDDPEGRFQRRADVLQRALEDEFERKGYRWVASDDEATYDVLAVVILGELKDHKEMQEFFGLYPALAKPAEGYGLGTILVAIAPAGTGDVVWRGALEVYTDPDKMPLAQRDQRLRWAAAKLLESIPTLP